VVQSECDSIYPLNTIQTFHKPVFTKNHKFSTALCADLSYRISPKSGNKCGNDGHTFAYVPNQSVPSIKSVFTKFVFDIEVCVENLCIGFHKNPTNG